MHHLTGLISTVAWLIRWPSLTEVWCCMSLVPLLFIPFPTILNNMLEWMMYLLMGNARGTGQHDSLENGKPPLSISAEEGLPGLARNLWTAIGNLLTSLNIWRQVLWNGRRPDENDDDPNLLMAAINRNNALLCYMQSEAMTKVHCVDPDVLEAFPTEVSNSRANAVMMARCATMSYDRWHNVDKAVADWSQDYKLLVAWSFDRVAVTSTIEGEVKPTMPQKMTAKVTRAVGNAVASPDAVEVVDSTSINTDVFLLEKAVTNADGSLKEIALVLAFRGTEALQTIDWISDLSQVQPPTNAMDPKIFPHGFTHQGFRDSLGLRRSLEPAESMDHNRFYNSYLIYKPVAGAAGEGELVRKPTMRPEDEGLKNLSPYTHITSYLSKHIKDAQKMHEAKCKLFVTGHSLGGALAHLYSGALLLAENRDSLVCDSFEAMYTFGEPRVGGQVFVDKLTDALNQIPNTRRAPDRFLRVVNTNDIVTRIPPPLGELYQHPGHLIFIKPQFAIMGRVGERIANATGGHTSTAEQSSTAPATSSAASDDASSRDTANGRPDDHVSAAGVMTLVSNGLSHSSIDPKSNKNEILSGSDITRSSDQSKAAATLNSLRTESGPLEPAAPASSSRMTPAREPGTAAYQRGHDLASAADDLSAEWNSQVYAPIKHLTETPDMYFEPLLLSGLVKFAGVILSTLDVIKITSKQLWISLIQQPLEQRPKLASNPLYAIARLAGVLGPGPFVLLLDVILLPLFLVMAPVTWPALLIEPVALLALFLFMPPFIMGGLVDHSMVEYYSACVLSSHADWTPY
eukprot:gene10579-10738_t